MNNKIVPFDKEEAELISSIENEEWVPIKNQKNIKE